MFAMLLLAMLLLAMLLSRPLLSRPLPLCVRRARPALLGVSSKSLAARLHSALGTLSLRSKGADSDRPSLYSQLNSSTNWFTLSLELRCLVKRSAGLTSPLTLRN